MSQTFASVENRVVEALRAQGRRSVAYQLKRRARAFAERPGSGSV